LPVRERLLGQYKKDGLVLFLGAGVSSGSKIPSWPALSSAVLEKAGITGEELEQVKKAVPSYITQFELAGQLLGNQRSLTMAIYEKLYEGMPCKAQLEEMHF
jgi:hypothetical protein